MGHAHAFVDGKGGRLSGGTNWWVKVEEEEEDEKNVYKAHSIFILGLISLPRS